VSSDADFEAWFESLSVDLGDAWSGAELRRRIGALERGFRSFYDVHGPADRATVEQAFLLHLVALARDNVATVMPDVERTTKLRPIVEVDECAAAVRVSVNGSYTTPSVEEWENPEALADLAGYIQEQVIDELNSTWPVCPDHGQVLIPEVHEGAAIWWCRSSEHQVAPVGDLGGAGRPSQRGRQ
jgi:hypothetical protein